MAKGVQNPTEWLATNIKDILAREASTKEDEKEGQEKKAVNRK